MSRIAAVRRLLDIKDAKGVIVTCLPHVRWLTGFRGSSGLSYVDQTRAALITDGRYRDQAAREAVGFEVHIADSDLFNALGKVAWIAEGDCILAQGEHVSCSQMERLRQAVPRSAFQVQDDLLSPLVAAKDRSEVELIQAAQEITDDVFIDLLEWLEPGMTEQQVAAEITCKHLRRGAERMAFEPIVASGPNGALPHARPGDRRLQDGDLVVIDCGCVWKGYASDMTRTIAVGDPNDRAMGAYEVVRQAQAAAIEAARSGIRACDLDRVARDRIDEGGFGAYFSHSLGHGVGLQVHEWPRISSSSQYELPPNVVVSIEPGIYVPDEFGVRIEDLVLLHPDGCTNLTGAPKELIRI